jgi:hypothetical protein
MTYVTMTDVRTIVIELGIAYHLNMHACLMRVMALQIGLLNFIKLLSEGNLSLQDPILRSLLLQMQHGIVFREKFAQEENLFGYKTHQKTCCVVGRYVSMYSAGVVTCNPTIGSCL